MTMKIKKLNNGSFQLGPQPEFEYWIEAPVKTPDTFELVDVLDVDGNPTLRQRHKCVASGKTLRNRMAVRLDDGTWIPNPDEPEHSIWHLYKMRYFNRDDSYGVPRRKMTLDVLDDNFVGSVKDAVAACEAHKTGG